MSFCFFSSATLTWPQFQTKMGILYLMLCQNRHHTSVVESRFGLTNNTFTKVIALLAIFLSDIGLIYVGEEKVIFFKQNSSILLIMRKAYYIGVQQTDQTIKLQPDNG